MPGISFHTLRRTYITEELRPGETDVKTISDSVGHAQISTTLDIYADSTMDMKRAAAERRQAAHDRKNETLESLFREILGKNHKLRKGKPLEILYFQGL